jgi:methionyl aminopeptidase
MRVARPRKPVIPVKTAQEIEIMRRSGKIVAMALQMVKDALKPGVTTGELDKIAENAIRGMGAIPAFLNYHGYPATACISINEEVVHGIPGSKVIKDGDLVSIDLGAILEGFYADSAWTFGVGEISDEKQALMQAGIDALYAGIDTARQGRRVRDIGSSVEKLALSRGYTVVKDMCGHGVGKALHEEPQIPNYWVSSADAVLKSGMTLAIEPMVNAGTYEIRILKDGWTTVTRDGKLSVHFEHTVAVTSGEPDILTKLI